MAYPGQRCIQLLLLSVFLGGLNSPALLWAQSVGSGSPNNGVRFFGGVTVGPGVRTWAPGTLGSLYVRRDGSGYDWWFPGCNVQVNSPRFGSLGTWIVPPSWYWYDGPGRFPSDFGFGFTDYMSRASYGAPVSLPGGLATLRTESRSQKINQPAVSFRPDFGRSLWESPNLTNASIAQVLRDVPATAVLDNEFTGLPHPDTESDHPEQQHLLSQADAAFRSGQWGHARTLYQTVLHRGSGKRQAWLRLAMTQTALAELPEAAASLRQALSLPSVSPDDWRIAAELLNETVPTEAGISDSAIRSWLLERPESTDRMLLAAAWQAFLGNEPSADAVLELLEDRPLSDDVRKGIQEIVWYRAPLLKKTAGAAQVPSPE